MSDSRRGLYLALGIAALIGGTFVSGGAYWLSAYREQNADQREYVARTNDQHTIEEVKRRCGGPVPAPADDCVQKVEDTEQAEKHEWADLKAQQDVAEWTFASFLANSLGIIISAGGLWALVWTFREQRKLTTNQSRAYLELVTAHYSAERYASIDEGEDTEDTITMMITLRNNGETPALRVKASLVFHCTPEASGFGDSGGDPYTIEGISGEIKEIPAKGTYVLRAYGRGALPHATMENTNWRYRGPELKARGKVTFDDVFGSPSREMELELDAPDIPSFSHEPPVEFYGPHRNRHGADRMLSHVKARLEKDLADAAGSRPKDEE